MVLYMLYHNTSSTLVVKAFILVSLSEHREKMVSLESAIVSEQRSVALVPGTFFPL